MFFDNPIEALAVAFGVLYLVLAVLEKRACWYAAAISTTLSIYLFWSVSLPMESALNAYYLIMAGYGWWQWSRGARFDQEPQGLGAGKGGDKGGEKGEGLMIRRFGRREHVLVLLSVTALTLLSGTFLHHSTDAAWPYVDSFTTWASVFTTWMVAKKILENWLYWLVIDAVSIGLYIDRGLHLYAGLFALYIVIAAFGYYAWRQRYAEQQAQVGAVE
ncbi:MAG: nicotinamide riboside transporter PnuC [Pseudomonadota bacterium]